MTYKLASHNSVFRADGWRIPFDPANTDYSQYLAWLSEGNTPEPADPLPPPVYTCSPWQIRKALNNQNLRQGVEDAIAASTDITLKDGWEFATEFRSDDPFVISMGLALGKDEAETAQLIQYASTL